MAIVKRDKPSMRRGAVQGLRVNKGVDRSASKAGRRQAGAEGGVSVCVRVERELDVV